MKRSKSRANSRRSTELKLPIEGEENDWLGRTGRTREGKKSQGASGSQCGHRGPFFTLVAGWGRDKQVSFSL